MGYCVLKAVKIRQQIQQLIVTTFFWIGYVALKYFSSTREKLIIVSQKQAMQAMQLSYILSPLLHHSSTSCSQTIDTDCHCVATYFSVIYKYIEQSK